MRTLGRVLGLALGLLLLGLFLRQTDLRELLRAVAQASPSLLLLGAAAILLSFWFRAVRWQVLLRPAGHTHVGRLFAILMVGYTVSNLVPGRLGDVVVRPYLAGRSEGISKTAALATIVVERIFDTLIVAVMFGVFLAFGGPQLSSADASYAGYLELARGSGSLLLLASLFAVAVLVWVGRHRARAQDWVARLGARLPERRRERVVAIAQAFVEGLSLFRSRRDVLLSQLWGALCWLAIAASMFVICRAFGLREVSYLGAFLPTALGVVGVAIPVPGGLGTFHWMVAIALAMLGAPGPETAISAAVVVTIHLTSVLPVTALGFFYWLRGGLLDVKLKQLAEEQS